jgi:acyl-CoA synthetase (AMP-forming)/AMP-acid ligase II
VFVVSDALRPLAEKLARLLPAGIARYMSGAAAPGWTSWDAALAAQPATPIADQIVGYDMLYSSGTTGRPKGVKPQFKNEPLGTLSPLLQLLVQKMCGVNEHSVYLSPAPLYHAAPLRFNMMVGALGGTSVIMERFDGPGRRTDRLLQGEPVADQMPAQHRLQSRTAAHADGQAAEASAARPVLDEEGLRREGADRNQPASHQS